MLQSKKVGRSGKSEEYFDFRLEDAEIGICPKGFWSSFGPVCLHYVSFPSLLSEKIHPVSLYVGSIRSAF